MEQLKKLMHLIILISHLFLIYMNFRKNYS